MFSISKLLKIFFFSCMRKFYGKKLKHVSYLNSTMTWNILRYAHEILKIVDISASNKNSVAFIVDGMD